MREIKVRAWIPEIQKFVYNNDMVDDFFFGIESGGLCVYQMADILMDEQPVTTYVNDAVIEQYTGLHDKYGKEIYEGDIVKLTCSDGIETITDISWLRGRYAVSYTHLTLPTNREV